MDKKIVYISSLSHSGSTLLDMMLGGHSKLIGLGEIAEAVMAFENGNSYKEEQCSCGKGITECDFWNKVIVHFKGNDNIKFEDRYRTVFDLFMDRYGHASLPIDSSKYMQHLKILRENTSFEIRVLFIIKDVRNYLISQIDNARKKGRYRWRKHNPLTLAWNWYLGNQKMKLYFKKSKLEYLQMGYEELCLYPNLMIQKICDFLEIENEPSISRLETSGSHAVFGNRMRNQAEKRILRYDNRWFYRNEWIIPILLLPHIKKFNKEQVYSNTIGKIWKM